MNDKLIFGKNCSYSSDTDETGLNNNVMVIGSTGSGKTCSVVIPRLINTFNSNLILTDPKRELLEKFTPMFKERGYDVLEINLIEPSKSQICFDPFAYLKKDVDVSTLSSSLMTILPEGTQTDRFWSYAGRSMIELIMRYTLEFKPHCTFSDFLKNMREVNMVEGSDSSRLSIYPVLQEFARTYPEHPLTMAYQNTKDVANRTLASILISCRTVLMSTFNPELVSMIAEKPTLNLDSFIRRKSVLFITSNGYDEGTNAYINFMYESIIHYMIEQANRFPDKKLPRPIHLIMDDFACGTKINSFPQLLTTFRSKGISSSIILQDESQLSTMYGNSEAKTIMNNNDTIVYLGGNDIITASDISKRLNIPLEEVLYMPLNRVMVFRRGQKPVITERYPIFEDNEYQRITQKSNLYEIAN